MKNNSPWLHQLDKERKIELLKSDLETDVAIVGGGIAGISTAFFLLKNTDKKVVLLEGGKIGHGATGHNAGQVVAVFERPFNELVSEFGLEMAAEGQRSIESGWAFMDQMYTEAKLDIPFIRLPGRGGLSSTSQVISYLEHNLAKKEAGLSIDEVFIDESSSTAKEIPEKFAGLYELVNKEKILDMLETRYSGFVAAVAGSQKGVVNSALFTEKVATYLVEQYKDRFSLYEHTHANKVVLHEDYAVLDTDIHTVKAVRVVLCTNGFETLRIFNKSGLDIDTRFHHEVAGLIGYMSGYLEPLDKPAAVFTYSIDPTRAMEDHYFYLTRRPYEYNTGKHNLISIGGPEIELEDMREYEKDHEYPEHAKEEIDNFIQKVYDTTPSSTDYIFTWHGLMGYTPNRVRLVGEEPKNPVLLYNLGCNGIGILPSIFGGERIAKLVKGEKLPPSIFDPKEK
jgi:glycine/D-amino acid oxidase-like deaminating enzyme